MGELILFEDFVAAHARASREEFLAQVTQPCLLFTGLELDHEAETGFETRRADRDAPTPHGSPRLSGLGGIQAVGTLTKAANAFGMMITVGRAKNNDVVVNDGRVSKFHAYFRQLGDRWTVTDANSTNGTKVDGLVVPAERSHVLRSQSQLMLGVLGAEFLVPEDLWERVQAPVS
jgi:FHA domain